MKRILFITSNRVGDAVLSSGVLARLIDENPGARVTIACGPAPAPLFEAVPGLERLIPMAKRKHSLHWLDLWRQTVRRRWDFVVDLRNSAVSYLLPTKRRLVFRSDKSKPIHRVVAMSALLGGREPPAPRLWLGATALDDAARLVQAGGPVLAVGPTANWGGKQWPAERFAETVARLTASGAMLDGARVVVCGAANERVAAAPVLDAVPAERRIDLVGGAGLATVAAAIGRADFYLGNDSGLMHIAAASGVPTLGLFGPSPEVLYAPWGPHTAVVRTRESYRELVDDPAFDHTSQRSLMDSLTVDAVVAAAERLWRQGRV